MNEQLTQADEVISLARIGDPERLLPDTSTRSGPVGARRPGPPCERARRDDRDRRAASAAGSAVAGDGARAAVALTKGRFGEAGELIEQAARDRSCLDWSAAST